MRTGIFWRSLARMFVVGFCFVGAVSLRAQQYQAIILPRPAKFVYAYGEGAGNSGRTSGWGIPAGGNYQADVRALLWINTQPPVDITPAGFRAARVDDAEGNQIVGSVSNNPETFSPRAFLWLNGGSAGVLLHPGGDYQFSEAHGAGGGQQAGYVYRAFYCAECGRFVFEHAALWSGTRESFVLLHASGADQSRALDTNGARQVGWGFLNKPNTPPYHALLWHGRDSLAVDLHPGKGFSHSFATAVGDGQQVGYGWGSATNGYSHALLWHGTAASVVDLNPRGFYISNANAVRDGIQVGSGARFSDSHNSALAWKGTPDSVINLHAVLPARYRLRDSVANDVDKAGNIVGVATENDTAQTVAVVWKPIDASP